ncbi:hypothetical protein BDW75DRAFT_24282 [Aspergillus navahoensis]
MCTTHASGRGPEFRGYLYIGVCFFVSVYWHMQPPFASMLMLRPPSFRRCIFLQKGLIQALHRAYNIPVPEPRYFPTSWATYT